MSFAHFLDFMSFAPDEHVKAREKDSQEALVSQIIVAGIHETGLWIE